VVQTLRSNNQEQKEDVYFGKVAVLNESKNDSPTHEIYQFGLFSLCDKKLMLQTGDIVSFQLIDCLDGSGASFPRRAFNVQLLQAINPASEQDGKKEVISTRASRDVKRGKVESIKGHVSVKKLPIFQLNRK
jgi:hypothetical protein